MHVTSNSIRPSVLARPKTRFSVMGLMDLWRQRAALARLNDAALKDVGVTREEAEREAGRSVWDVPAHWRN
ncbi:MAG: DUF1127 domain-containing protein [Pseudomonadota bacterium]